MDPIADLLSGPRARGAFVLRAILSPPWSLRVEDEAPLTLIALVRGSAWITPAGGEPVLLGPGDVAIVRGPEPYHLADVPGRPAEVVIRPDQQCTSVDGESVAETMGLGVRTWGNDSDGETVMLTGTYQTPGELSQPLLNSLPGLLVLREADWESETVLPLLRAEVAKDSPAQAVLLDRLLDLLLITALRAWFTRQDAGAPAWYRAQSDPLVGRALRLLQNDPAHAWTVAGLAARLGVSRALLARRFAELVGEPPIAFLTGWRLALAADLLREPGSTLGTVARKVGYGSGFALSTAFKRNRGVSPREHRAA
ncbi:AraC family transcriptional regulator [Longispora albida]|uniref:AraC family transcriptional regulator n=1 Tax=Longispora albida TaxID=203523 RepID=UPI00036E3EF9|nr:AraC family transcriptional regulator [Longispora albida]